MLISPQKSFFINYTFMKLDQVVDVNKMKFHLIISFDLFYRLYQQ